MKTGPMEIEEIEGVWRNMVMEIEEIGDVWRNTVMESRILAAKQNTDEYLAMDLSCNETLPKSLFKLNNLRQLNLANCIILTSLAGLEHLPSLQHLELSYCYQLTDLSALSSLVGLQHLNLFRGYQLTHLSALSSLVGLQLLDLFYCDQLTDLSALSSLTGLQHLNLALCEQLTDLSALSKLSSLQTLILLSCRNLTNITAIPLLSALKDLDLSGCTSLPSLPALHTLKKLRRLALDFPFPCAPAKSPIRHLPELTHLAASQLEDAPQELAYLNERDGGKACLARIIAWQNDLIATGSASNPELKLFILGNGAAGKTQLARRLQGLPYDAAIASTHGVQLGRFPLFPARDGHAEVCANQWDFGGQDIYLGTHSLFLDARAIYLVVWSKNRENDDCYDENGTPMRNRPLGYWLEYIHSLAGKDAPVIVVQAQCDTESESQEPPIPSDHGFAYLKRITSSAKQEDGLEELWPALRKAAKLLQERQAKVILPNNWLALAATLRGLRDAGTRTLGWDEFEQLCHQQHQFTQAQVVANYLHSCGQVFWRAGVFANQVVLDQAWALEGMYAVLHRAKSLPLIRKQGGLFSGELLSILIWQDRSPEDQQVFLQMMQQCRTCFKVADDQYIAPDLLPEQAQSQVAAFWHNARPQAALRLDYAFLHEGIVRGLLCAVGEQAGANAAYWRSGVCFYDGKTKGPVKIWAEVAQDDSAKRRGSIFIEVAGRNANDLARHLADSIIRIGFGNKPTLISLTDTPDHLTTGDAVSEQACDFSAIKPISAPPPAGAQAIIHFSYAWGDASEQTTDDLERILRDAGYQVRRDKSAMRAGGWISDFMREIGQAKHVVVVLSKKYLHSIYCMRELLYLYQISLGNKQAMMEKIIPVVLTDAAISTSKQRLDVVRHWERQLQELRGATTGLDPQSWGNTTIDELLLIADFVHRSSDMLAWCADVLMPRGSALHGDGGAAILALIEQKCGEYASKSP